MCECVTTCVQSVCVSVWLCIVYKVYVWQHIQCTKCHFLQPMESCMSAAVWCAAVFCINHLWITHFTQYSDIADMYSVQLSVRSFSRDVSLVCLPLVTHVLVTMLMSPNTYYMYSIYIYVLVNYYKVYMFLWPICPAMIIYHLFCLPTLHMNLVYLRSVSFVFQTIFRLSWQMTELATDNMSSFVKKWHGCVVKTGIKSLRVWIPVWSITFSTPPHPPPQPLHTHTKTTEYGITKVTLLEMHTGRDDHLYYSITSWLCWDLVLPLYRKKQAGDSLNQSLATSHTRSSSGEYWPSDRFIHSHFCEAKNIARGRRLSFWVPQNITWFRLDHFVGPKEESLLLSLVSASLSTVCESSQVCLAVCCSLTVYHTVKSLYQDFAIHTSNAVQL